MFDKDDVQKATQYAKAEFTYPLNSVPITMKDEFYRRLYRIVPAVELAKYHGAMLVAIGTEDDIVWPQPTSVKAILSYHQGEHELWTKRQDICLIAIKWRIWSMR